MTDSQPDSQTHPQTNPQPDSPSPMPTGQFVDADSLYSTEEFVGHFIRELPAPGGGRPPTDIPVPIIDLTPHLPPLRTVGPVWGVIEEYLIEFAETAMLELSPAMWETRSEHERWFYTPSPVAIRHYPDWGFVVGNFDPDLKEWVCTPIYLSHSIVQAVRAILFAVIDRRAAVDEESLRRWLSNNAQYIEEYLASAGETDPLNPPTSSTTPQPPPGEG